MVKKRIESAVENISEDLGIFTETEFKKYGMGSPDPAPLNFVYVDRDKLRVDLDRSKVFFPNETVIDYALWETGLKIIECLGYVFDDAKILMSQKNCPIAIEFGFGGNTKNYIVIAPRF